MVIVSQDAYYNVVSAGCRDFPASLAHALAIHRRGVEPGKFFGNPQCGFRFNPGQVAQTIFLDWPHEDSTDRYKTSEEMTIYTSFLDYTKHPLGGSLTFVNLCRESGYHSQMWKHYDSDPDILRRSLHPGCDYACLHPAYPDGESIKSLVDYADRCLVAPRQRSLRQSVQLEFSFMDIPYQPQPMLF